MYLRSFDIAFSACRPTGVRILECRKFVASAEPFTLIALRSNISDSNSAKLKFGYDRGFERGEALRTTYGLPGSVR